MRLFVALPAMFLFAAACGSSATDNDHLHPDGGPIGPPGTPDAAPVNDTPDAGPFQMGQHPALPQIQNAGGPVLTSPKVVPIFFPGYDHRSEVVDLVNTIGAQPYWSAATSEYSVGALSVGAPIDLTESAPGTIDNTAIQTWLKGKLNGGTFGTPSGQTIYTIFYPKSTTVTQAFGAASSCVQFGGYHDDFALNASTQISYAVIPECDELNRQVGVDGITAAASHEWVEAATDPYPHSRPAYLPLDSNHAAWGLALGATENGDMCAIGIGQNYYKPGGYSHVIQRSWSNAAAAAGNLDPCLPAVATTPYFNAGAVFPDTVQVLVQFNFITTKGVKIPVGQSKTIDVQLFSTGPVGDIKVKAIDLASALSGNAGDALNTFSWNKTVGQNGETLKLTITAVKAPGAFSPPATFIIISHVGAPDAQGIYAQGNWWPGVVVN